MRLLPVGRFLCSQDGSCPFGAIVLERLLFYVFFFFFAVCAVGQWVGRSLAATIGPVCVRLVDPAVTAGQLESQICLVKTMA